MTGSPASDGPAGNAPARWTLKAVSPLEHRMRFAEASLLHQVVDEPETAGEQRALTGRQAVFGFTGITWSPG